MDLPLRPFCSLVVLFFLATHSGCRAAESITALPAAELQTAPLSITVAGQTLLLETELWRDFQPSSPPNGRPLIAFLRVRPADGGTLTAFFQIDALWIANGAETWATAVEEGHLTPGSASYEGFARDGPKWNPGVHVDVVVRIREPSGATQLLRAASQLIQRSA